MEFVPKEELVLDPLPEGPVNEAAKVGERIRALRADRFSLEALASKAGISAGMLSQVENGRGNPTFRMLYRVAGALGVEVEQLLEPSPRRPTSIVRRTDPMRTRTARGFRISAMTPAADRGLAVCTVHLTPGAEHDVLGDYDGDFCVWVRTGTLTIKSADISVDLGVGDTVYLQSLPHVWVNATDSSVEAITMYSSAEWIASLASRREPTSEHGSVLDEIFFPSGGGTAAPADQLADLDDPRLEGRLRDLGKSIRRQRRRRMTLAEFAKQTQLSIGLLSRLENGGGNPSLQALTRIASALDTSVAMLLTPTEERQPQIVRQQHRRQLTDPLVGGRYEVLTPRLDGRFVAFIWLLTGSRRISSLPHRHDGDEFISVLRGQVELTVDASAYQLAEGDSATYDSANLHQLRRVGDEPVELLAVRTSEIH